MKISNYFYTGGYAFYSTPASCWIKNEDKKRCVYKVKSLIAAKLRYNISPIDADPRVFITVDAKINDII